MESLDILNGDMTPKYDKYNDVYTVNIDSDIKIKSITLSHDVTDIRGYVIEENGSSMVYITDTGYISEKSFKTQVSSL